jgi:hypothetical protein
VPSNVKEPLFSEEKATPFTRVAPKPAINPSTVIPEPVYDLGLAASIPNINPFVTILG